MKKRRLPLTKKNALYGLLFMIPFYLGFLMFYLTPIIESISFGFNDVTVDIGGYSKTFVGFDNFKAIFTEDADFTTNLIAGAVEMLWKVPVILILALFLAVLLNQDFKGRVFVRAVFFLPVIFSSGVVLDIIQGDLVVSSTLNGASLLEGEATMNTAVGLNALLINSGISETIVSLITTIANKLFSLVWSSGIQMIIFLAGLQSIPTSLYEAASVEGATSWEKFWKITLPMLIPILLMNTVYTIVDDYTAVSNKAMKQVLNNISNDRFGLASAMTWSYFGLIAIILVGVFLIFKKADSSKGAVK